MQSSLCIFQSHFCGVSLLYCTLQFFNSFQIVLVLLFMNWCTAPPITHRLFISLFFKVTPFFSICYRRTFIRIHFLGLYNFSVEVVLCLKRIHIVIIWNHFLEI